VSCWYWPGSPPLQPVKLVEVLLVHVTAPDEPKTIAFGPALKFDVLETLIVAPERQRAVSVAGPESTNGRWRRLSEQAEVAAAVNVERRGARKHLRG
jgi:hypothetical protein